MLKEFLYKNRFLFFLLKKYWSIIYFYKIFFVDAVYYFSLTKSQFQNEENIFITNLSKYLHNKNLIEIGYHYRELNCIGLIKSNFNGKLVDANMSDILNKLIMKMIIKNTCY